MKKFFVSKSDENKVNFINKSIKEINPNFVYILCEESRMDIFKDINAVILPLKDLNKTTNWITFVNTFSKDSLLIIDNVLKFIFFGDGKKKYLKDISQSINNIIVMDVVPFYTEPHEIFYPFWFLGKEILGYNSYNTFKSNHLEEKKDGNIDVAHSFDVLKDKIKEYYIQDYKCFFDNVEFNEFLMNEDEVNNYNTSKEIHSKDFSNPIKMYREVSTSINEISSRYNYVISLMKSLKNTAIIVNYSGHIPRYKKIIGDHNYITTMSNTEILNKYDNIIIMMLPIVKPHEVFYLLQAKCIFHQLHLKENNLEQYFFNKIYNNSLRNQFDKHFTTKL